MNLQTKYLIIIQKEKCSLKKTRMARDNEILMTTDEWKRAKERAEEAFNEKRSISVYT